MKKIRILSIFIALALITISVRAEEPLSKAFNGVKGVSCVYISKAAMNLGLNIAAQSDDKDVSNVISCIKNPGGMEVISAEKASTVKLVKDFAEKKLSQLKMETLLSTVDGDETVNIYVGEMVGNLMKDVIITTSSPKEYTLVYIKGEIDPVKLTQLENK